MTAPIRPGGAIFRLATGPVVRPATEPGQPVGDVIFLRHRQGRQFRAARVPGSRRRAGARARIHHPSVLATPHVGDETGEARIGRPAASRSSAASGHAQHGSSVSVCTIIAGPPPHCRIPFTRRVLTLRKTSARISARRSRTGGMISRGGADLADQRSQCRPTTQCLRHRPLEHGDTKEDQNVLRQC